MRSASISGDAKWRSLIRRRRRVSHLKRQGAVERVVRWQRHSAGGLSMTSSHYAVTRMTPSL